MYVGVDYYPEHWPRERWETDAEMMQRAGFNVVRMAEFAWSKLEPNEGEYDFEWLDSAIEILGRHGIAVILGTPTGSMPPWVAIKYPESVAVDESGHRMPYGARKTNCPTSLSYRMLGLRITRAMAEHYRDNPHVIGWQPDNEFSWPNCYCDTCLADWRDWLRRKFGTIDQLNESWGTIFWSHVFRSFDEVPLPKGSGYGWTNPSFHLDYRRFFSDCVVRFQNEQVRVLRSIAPHQFVTHNAMGLYSTRIDHYDLAKELDHISWDYYNNTVNPWHEGAWVWGGASNDLMRSLKHKGFWIMETSAGPTGAATYSCNVRPGHMRHTAFHCVGHGADGYIWFRWRTCRYGYEQFWHGLLGHDGGENRRYREAAGIAHELRAIGDELAGTQVKGQAAIVFSYEDEWAFEIQPNSHGFRRVEYLQRLYSSLRRAGLNVDFVKPGDDLSSYGIVIAPANYIVTREIAESYEKFVQNGGTLIITFRSGVKDQNNIPHELVLPGLLAGLAGVRVEEYESIPAGVSYRLVRQAGFSEGGQLTGTVFADWILPTSASPLLKYDEPGIEGYSAATVNEYGRGRVYYVGTAVGEDSFYADLIARAMAESGIQVGVRPPEGVEVCTRSDDEKELIFVINHTREQRQIELPEGIDLLSGQAVGGVTTLEPEMVLVVRHSGGAGSRNVGSAGIGG